MRGFVMSNEKTQSIAGNFRKKIFSRNFLEKTVILMVLIMLIIVFTSSSKYFFSARNFLSIGMTVCVIGLIAIGETMCIICRGFDLSVGSVAALGGVIFSEMVLIGMPVAVAVILGLSFGLLAGLINGISIAIVKVNAFIVTFVWLQIYKGIIYIITGGMSITIVGNEAFKFLGTYKIFDVLPLPVVILIVFYAMFAFILKYTTYGRKLYCVGGNPDACIVSGINVKRIQIQSYVITSFLAALGGIIFSSRVSAMQPTIGDSYALDSISAAVLGGTAMTGGKGNVLGTLLGVLIIGVIQNGLIMINLNAYYQYIATGAIMFIAVALHLNK
jgi:ribose transport system permease protein